MIWLICDKIDIFPHNVEIVGPYRTDHKVVQIFSGASEKEMKIRQYLFSGFTCRWMRIRTDSGHSYSGHILFRYRKSTSNSRQLLHFIRKLFRLTSIKEKEVKCAGPCFSLLLCSPTNLLTDPCFSVLIDFEYSFCLAICGF